jgi:hypothetical protein
LLFGSMAGGLRADSILFTPPAVPLEAPPKLEEALPNARPDQLDFAAPSQGVMVPPRQHMLQRQQPREYDPDDEEMKHPLLRDPKKMADPLTKLVPKSPTEKWLDKVEARKKEEKKDSLSPLTTFDWREDLHNRDGLGRKDLAEGGKTQKKEREDERDTNPFRLGKDQDRQKERERERSNFQGVGLNAPQLLDQREKSLLADVERRAAAFDELLNPRQEPAAPSARQRSSLEPVTGFDAPKPDQSTVAAPRIGQQVVRAPLDPTKAFEERQQRRLQSSVLEDLNARFGPQTKASSLKPTTEPTFSTPLLRQPLTRDFPTRNF